MLMTGSVDRWRLDLYVNMPVNLINIIKLIAVQEHMLYSPLPEKIDYMSIDTDKIYNIEESAADFGRCLGLARTLDAELAHDGTALLRFRPRETEITVPWCDDGFSTEQLL